MAYVTDAAREYAKKHACDENLTEEHKILLKKLQKILSESAKMLIEAEDIHDRLIDNFKDGTQLHEILNDVNHAYHATNNVRMALEQINLD